MNATCNIGQQIEERKQNNRFLAGKCVFEERKRVSTGNRTLRLQMTERRRVVVVKPTRSIGLNIASAANVSAKEIVLPPRRNTHWRRVLFDAGLSAEIKVQ